MNQELPYAQVNPVVLAPAVAPHIALAEAGVALDAAALHARCLPALAWPHDVAVVEGAGGWRVSRWCWWWACGWAASTTRC